MEKTLRSKICKIIDRHYGGRRYVAHELIIILFPGCKLELTGFHPGYALKIPYHRITFNFNFIVKNMDIFDQIRWEIKTYFNLNVNFILKE